MRTEGITEGYRWERQDKVRAHIRDLAMLEAWNAATAETMAGARKEAAPTPPEPIPIPTPTPRIPRETLARERAKLDYLWSVWCEMAAAAAAGGWPIPPLEEAAAAADSEGWGE